MDEPAVSTKTDTEVIRLTDQAGKIVVVSTADGDRFTVPARVAAKACKSFERFEEFSEQLDRLITRLYRWTREHGDEIDRAYFVVDRDGPTFIVIRRDTAFNPDFEDALSKLNLDLYHQDRLHLIALRVLTLPFCTDAAVASFVGLDEGPIIRLN